MRRLGIITLEDVGVHPEYTTLTCLLLQNDNTCTLNKKSFLLRYVEELCLFPTKTQLREGMPVLEWMDESVVKASDKKSELIKGIFMRASYGGMKHDVDMVMAHASLHEHITTSLHQEWALYLAKHPAKAYLLTLAPLKEMDVMRAGVDFICCGFSK